MGIKELLFGRSDGNYKKEKERAKEAEFHRIRKESAIKKGKEEGKFSAGGGLFGALGRGMQKTAAYQGKKLVKDMKSKSKSKSNDKSQSRRINPLMPSAPPFGLGSPGGMQVNTNNVMPIGWDRKKKD